MLEQCPANYFRGQCPPGVGLPRESPALGRAGVPGGPVGGGIIVFFYLPSPKPSAPHVSTYGNVGAGWAGVLGVYPRSWPRTSAKSHRAFRVCSRNRRHRDSTLSRAFELIDSPGCSRRRHCQHPWSSASTSTVCLIVLGFCFWQMPRLGGSALVKASLYQTQIAVGPIIQEEAFAATPSKTLYFWSLRIWAVSAI